MGVTLARAHSVLIDNMVKSKRERMPCDVLPEQLKARQEQNPLSHIISSATRCPRQRRKKHKGTPTTPAPTPVCLAHAETGCYHSIRFDNMRQQNGRTCHVVAVRAEIQLFPRSVESLIRPSVWQRISPLFLCVCWRLTPRSLSLWLPIPSLPPSPIK